MNLSKKNIIVTGANKALEPLRLIYCIDMVQMLFVAQEFWIRI